MLWITMAVLGEVVLGVLFVAALQAAARADRQLAKRDGLAESRQAA
jgi:hypothetical protein